MGNIGRELPQFNIDIPCPRRGKCLIRGFRDVQLIRLVFRQDDDFTLFKINKKSDCAWIPTTHIHAMNINNPRLIHSPPIFDVKVTFF